MIADVVEYSPIEGHPWMPWPWGKAVKPSNPELLTKRSKIVAVLRCIGHPTGAIILMPVHAIKLDNGVEWDCINGFRKREGPQ